MKKITVDKGFCRKSCDLVNYEVIKDNLELSSTAMRLVVKKNSLQFWPFRKKGCVILLAESRDRKRLALNSFVNNSEWLQKRLKNLSNCGKNLKQFLVQISVSMCQWINIFALPIKLSKKSVSLIFPSEKFDRRISGKHRSSANVNGNSALVLDWKIQLT